MLLLAFHCGAMFFRSVAGAIPGSGAVIHDIRSLGTASLLWHAVPAVALLWALDRLPPPVLAVVAVTLLAVGVTMYDHGPLDVHLTAIFVAVACLVAAVATLVRPPARS